MDKPAMSAEQRDQAGRALLEVLGLNDPAPSVFVITSGDHIALNEVMRTLYSAHDRRLSADTLRELAKRIDRVLTNAIEMSEQSATP